MNQNNNSLDNIYFKDYLKNGKQSKSFKNLFILLLPIIVLVIIIIIVILLVNKPKPDNNPNYGNAVSDAAHSMNNLTDNDYEAITKTTTAMKTTTVTFQTTTRTTTRTTTETTFETTTHPNNEYSTGFVITQTDPLNVRETPDKSSKIIGAIPKGGEVIIISEKGDMYEIDYFGTTGYIAKNYISFSKDDIPPDNASDELTGKINTERDPLNVRKEPSTSSKILGTIPKNNTVTIIDDVGEWYVINFKGEQGYISKKYVMIID